MGKFTDSWHNAKAPARGSDGPIVAELRQRCPELCSALVGSCEREGEPIQAFSLTFFVNDGRLRFCLGLREGSDAAFGEIDDVGDALRAVEEAIAEDRIGWKQDRAKKRH